MFWAIGPIKRRAAAHSRFDLDIAAAAGAGVNAVDFDHHKPSRPTAKLYCLILSSSVVGPSSQGLDKCQPANNLVNRRQQRLRVQPDAQTERHQESNQDGHAAWLRL